MVELNFSYKKSNDFQNDRIGERQGMDIMRTRRRVQLIFGLTLLLVAVLTGILWGLIHSDFALQRSEPVEIVGMKGAAGSAGSSGAQAPTPEPEPAKALPSRPQMAQSASEPPAAELPARKPPAALPSTDSPRSPNLDRLVSDLRHETAAGIKFGNIAYNTPSEMNVEESAIVELKLGLDTSIEDLKKSIEAAGNRAGARIRVSEVMEATLRGADFHITSVTPEQQAISSSDISEWRWAVKPKSVGTYELHLTISAFVTVNGKLLPTAVKVFSRKIAVTVTMDQQLRDFLSKNWQWLWGIALAPLLGWIWKQIRKAEAPS